MSRAPAVSLRVATYNIHRAIGMDRRQDPARVARVISELKADVVGLQEVEWEHHEGEAVSQFEYLTHLPGFTAIPGSNIQRHRGHYGNLVLTRLPVLEVKRIDLRHSAREPRGAIDVKLESGRGPVRVVVTHFGLGLRERARQAARLRDVLGQDDGCPTLLLGDFNDWLPGSPTLRPFTRLCIPSPRPRSFPANWPVLALDLVLARGFSSCPKVSAHATRLARVASDHLPIIATVEVDGAA